MKAVYTMGRRYGRSYEVTSSDGVRTVAHQSAVIVFVDKRCIRLRNK